MNAPIPSVSPPTAGGRRPPRAPAWPLVGSLPRFLADPFRFAVETHRRCGDIYRLDLGMLDLLVLNHPRHARHVLRDRTRIYVKGGALMESMRSVVGNGLLLSEGELWRRQRRLMQPHFNRKNLEAMSGVMLAVIDRALDGWDPLVASGRPFDVVPELSKITMQAIVGALFGAELDDRDIRTIGDAIVDIQYYVLRGAAFQSMPAWLPRPGQRKFQRSLAAIDAILARFIAQQRSGRARPGTLLATLVDGTDEATGERMNDAQLRDELVTMLLAGYETTAQTVSWALYYLAADPIFAAQMTAEIDLLCGATPPSFAQLPPLTSTHNALKEALRLRGPVFWTWRTATEDDEIDGFAVPAGTTVALNFYAMHRHPALWSSPEAFDPGRFAPGHPHATDPSAWLPFGTGQRQCIGLDFAMIEGLLILARVAQRYRLRAVPGREPRPRLGTTIMAKDGIWLLAERRDECPTTP